MCQNLCTTDLQKMMQEISSLDRRTLDINQNVHNFWTISLTCLIKIFASGILFSHSVSIHSTWLNGLLLLPYFSSTQFPSGTQ